MLRYEALFATEVTARRKGKEGDRREEEDTEISVKTHKVKVIELRKQVGFKKDRKCTDSPPLPPRGQRARQLLY